MPDQQLITLTKPWGRHPAGQVLKVWAPDVDLAGDVVDPQRAACLVADGLAVQGIPEPAAKKGRKE